MSIDLLIDLTCVIPASCALLRAWTHDGGLFQETREAIERWGYSDAPHRFMRLRGLIAALLTCRFCLSYHTPFWLGLYVAAAHFSPPAATLAMLFPVWSLAATYAASWLLELGDWLHANTVNAAPDMLYANDRSGRDETDES